MGVIWRQLSRTTRRALAGSALASVLLPWLVGEFAKSFHQPGLSNHWEREALFIDILVVAVIVFALTMVFTVLLGCLITASMKGPRHFGDAFPSDSRNDD